MMTPVMRVRSRTGRFFADLGAAVQITLLGVGASVTYGILHDQYQSREVLAR